ncbi:uncharacterized protein BO72DRAFT_494561 [Aspergillus fijiensis CBS 313.89]|uniref:Uncharacterized protein n=1 Tax=Aspergillus fijiensis CBS 313.89 TaxID=1448319 RepID=A0A8G1W1B0_9EURO|nr:uncharacterized protein BO72DRAFT_494561 [Aspergillus fijiensis CBS 313.89]RAK79216.1 hypothetical protein BO72DRAFT_494561 [Aspergillus fijiensis CBS 313.89]
MPRNLPWLLDTTASSKHSSSSSATRPRASTPQPRRAGATSSSSAAAAAAASSSTTRNNARKLTSSPPGSGGSRTRRRDFLRSSPTPPSSPIHRCPSEEYLIPGLQNDDIYMMVEDEFYSVAQSFTQHLHYAEYVRRKKEVKAQQRELLQQQQQQRPTDGVTPLSEESRKRNAQEELAARQREGLETMTAGVRPVVSGDEDEGEAEDDEAWAGTSLHELMVSPRKNRSLVGVQGIRSATRAAAGFAQAAGGVGRRVGAGIGGAGDGGSRHGRDDGHQVDDDQDATASDDEDDDLDAPAHAKTTPHQVSRRRQTRRSPPLPTEEYNYATSSDASPTSSSYETPTVEPKSKKAQSMNATTTTYRTPTPIAIKSKRRLIFDDWDQLPEPPPKSNIQVQSRMSSSSSSEAPPPPPPQNPRGIDPKAKKKSRLNEVPTFLL